MKGDVIGKGQFGTVYRAEWRGSQVAVKVINMLPEMQNTNLEDIKELNICR
jgi:predicted Ser/Thr protein kinase